MPPIAHNQAMHQKRVNVHSRQSIDRKPRPQEFERLTIDTLAEVPMPVASVRSRIVMHMIIPNQNLKLKFEDSDPGCFECLSVTFNQPRALVLYVHVLAWIGTTHFTNHQRYLTRRRGAADSHACTCTAARHGSDVLIPLLPTAAGSGTASDRYLCC